MNVKDLILKPICSKVANESVKKWHYSGKVVNNSTLHFGVFYNNVLLGVMSFGSPMDKSKVIGLVAGTKWNGMLELNRMAFSDALPKNAESRALSVAFRLIKKHYPHIEWILSFADATQCGDGTIYRASGFVLTGVKKNSTIMMTPDGEKITNLVLDRPECAVTRKLVEKYNIKGRVSASAFKKQAGFKTCDGFMIRYIKFLNPEARKRLTVPELPFSAIKEAHASMCLGKSV